MANNISLNIVANAQFQQVYAEVARLKEAMASLQKVSVGGPFTSEATASIKASQRAFDNAVLSTRAFTVQHVAMQDAVTKFGKSLQAGKLNLNQYYKIWRDSAKGVSSELDALATQQARLNRSIAIADPLRPGYAKLVTDINGVVTAQEKQLFYQKALNTSLHDGSMKLIDFGKNTQWMGRQLTVGLSMPLAMFGATASQTFLKVDQELTKLAKVYGTGLATPSKAALASIRSEVLALGNDLAKTMGVAVQDTASMAAGLAATGQTGAGLLSSTREAIRLATLGELDHQQAMQATISLQNVYKLNTQGLSQAVDFLNAVENQTSTSLQDLVDAIPRVGPVVAQLGGSFKDTAAMMVAMKEAGVPAAQAANAIKSAMASLVNPTKAAREAFKGYNIDLTNIANSTNGNPVQMIVALQKAMSGLGELQKAQLIEKLFGKFQESRIMALINNLNKAGSQTQTVFQLMGASSQDLANLAANELKQQTESASGRFKRMLETIKADLVPIGQSFLNAFSRLGNAVDHIVKGVQSLSHMLGPVAGILGKLFGGGLVGMIVIGPILMLVGLFANLTGNILKGANYMRMFRQGMQEALPAENAFVSGLRNMRNFYENLDAGAVAARNQMELMPEAVTSNVTAFTILNKAIADLTRQFEALAIAQREAMGLGPIPGGKGKVRLPGFAAGGWVPGDPAKGDVYPALLTGQEFVVPYPQSVKYGSFLSEMLDGKLPKHGTGAKPGRIGSGASGRVGKSGATVVRPYSANVSNTGGLVNFSDIASGNLADLASLYATKIAAEAEVSINAINREISLWQKANAPLMQQAMEAVKNGISHEEAFSGLMNKFVTDMESANGPVSKFIATTKQMAPKLEADLIQAQIAAKEMNLNLHNGAEATLLADKLTENMLAQELASPGNFMRLSKTRQAAAAIFGGAQGMGTYGVPRIMLPANIDTKEPLYKAGTSQEHISTTLVQEQNAQILREARAAARSMLVAAGEGFREGVADAAAMHSNSKETYKQGEFFVGGGLAGIKSRLGEAKAAGASLATAEVTGFEQAMLPGMAAAGAAGMTTHGSAFFPTIGLREGMPPIETATSKLGRFANMFKNRPSGANYGFGSAAMIAPMALQAVPGSIAGTDISGAKDALSSGIMMGGMAAMFGPTAPFALAIGLAVGGLKLLSIGLHKYQEDMRIAGAVAREEASVGSVAANYFHLQTDNLKNLDFSTALKNFNTHAQSIQKNKEAVDALTLAYKNAADQQTKDMIKGVQGKTGKDLTQFAIEKYASDVAAGLGPVKDPKTGVVTDKAKEDLVAILKAADKNNLQIAYALAALPKLASSGAGFNAQIANSVSKFMLDDLKKFKPETYKQLMSSSASDYKALQTNNQFSFESMSDVNPEGRKKATQSLYTAALGSPGNLNTIISQMNNLTKGVLNTNIMYKEFNGLIAKTNPELAQLFDKYRKTGMSTTEMAKATSLLNAGLGLTVENINQVLSKAGSLDALFNMYSLLQGLSTTAPTDTQAAKDAAKKATDVQKVIDGKQAEIDKINEEKAARDELYNAQMRNIEAQQAEMNAEEDIIRARGTGDLLKIAAAQRALVVQRTKDKMAEAKAQRDSADAARIKELEKQIKDLQKQKDKVTTPGDPAAPGKSPYEKAKDLLDQIWKELTTDTTSFLKDIGTNMAALIKVFGLKKAEEAMAQALGQLDFATFNKNIKSIYDQLVAKIGKEAALKVIVDAYHIELSKMDWSHFKKGVMDEFNSLAPIIGEKAAAAIVFKEIKIRISDDAVKALGDATGKKLAEDVDAIFQATLKERPAKAKEILAAYTDFAGGIADDLKNSKLKGSALQKEIAKQAYDAATKAYADELASADPATRKKAQDARDKLAKELADRVNTDMETGANQAHPSFAARAAAWFRGVFSAIGNWFSDVLSSIKKGIMGWVHDLAFPGFATGGLIKGAGTGTSDSIMARVSNGEYVVSADAVSKYGPGMLNAINNKTFSMPNRNYALASSSKISDAINSSTEIGGNTIHVYPPVGADANQVAQLVMGKLDMARQKQATARRIGSK